MKHTMHYYIAHAMLASCIMLSAQPSSADSYLDKATKDKMADTAGHTATALPSSSPKQSHAAQQPSTKPQQQAPRPSVDKLIENYYQGISGFGIPDDEIAMIRKDKAAPTYGEITVESAKKLLAELQLTPNDVFYDLGAGVGKLTVQTYLSSPVKKAVGIEISPQRCTYASNVCSHLQKDGLVHPDRTLQCIEGNCIRSSLEDATVIFMCSTCFSSEFMQELADKFVRECKPGLKVVSLKRLPESSRFALQKELTLPMSWSSGSAVHIYTMN